MTYPVKDATYKHSPKWIDRERELERRDTTPFKQPADDGMSAEKQYQNDATMD
jgi:hypothetical protein